jgi:hypothetical protein
MSGVALPARKANECERSSDPTGRRSSTSVRVPGRVVRCGRSGFRTLVASGRPRSIRFTRLERERITSARPIATSVVTRPRVAARSSMGGASWRATKGAACGGERLIQSARARRLRRQCAFRSIRVAPDASDFPSFDPVREAGARIDSTLFTPPCSSPPPLRCAGALRRARR